MEWFFDVLRAPLAELVELVALAGLALVTGRLRARQHRAHDVLRAEGVLPPRP